MGERTKLRSTALNFGAIFARYDLRLDVGLFHPFDSGAPTESLAVCDYLILPSFRITRNLSTDSKPWLPTNIGAKAAEC